jgi:hypothetical protein
MGSIKSYLARRRIAAIVVCVLIGTATLAVMVDSGRDTAIAAAKKHGKVFILRGQVYSVTLPSRKAVDEVLPLLDHVSELRELVIYGVDLTPDDLQAIARLTSLSALRLDGCGLRGAELDPLGDLTNVTELHLIKNPLTDRGMQFMHSMTKLEKVDLNFTTIRGEGIKYLGDLPALKVLWLTGTGIDDETVILCGNLKKLEVLWLTETRVTARGAMQLVEMHWLRELAPPSTIPGIERQRLGDAFVAARRKARAAGKDVPTHDNPPIEWRS